MTGTIHTEHGDRELALRGEILRTVVGSGLRRPADHYVYRTQPEGARSGPGDTDLVLYSLRKYLRLATAGNPTVLLPLFAPTEAVLPRPPSPLGLDLSSGGGHDRHAANPCRAECLPGCRS